MMRDPKTRDDLLDAARLSESLAGYEDPNDLAAQCRLLVLGF